jgi:hypothetical protein
MGALLCSPLVLWTNQVFSVLSYCHSFLKTFFFASESTKRDHKRTRNKSEVEITFSTMMVTMMMLMMKISKLARKNYDA